MEKSTLEGREGTWGFSVSTEFPHTPNNQTKGGRSTDGGYVTAVTEGQVVIFSQLETK